MQWQCLYFGLFKYISPGKNVSSHINIIKNVSNVLQAYIHIRGPKASGSHSQGRHPCLSGFFPLPAKGMCWTVGWLGGISGKVKQQLIVLTETEFAGIVWRSA